jgi:hypothetical protein
LPLSTRKAGLTPFGVSAEEDKYLLRLRSTTGNEYSFRPLRRNALGTVPERYGRSLKMSVQTNSRQTWVPSQHPYAPIVVSHLERAAGLLTQLLSCCNCLMRLAWNHIGSALGGKLGFLEPDAREYHQEKLDANQTRGARSQLYHPSSAAGA